MCRDGGWRERKDDELIYDMLLGIEHQGGENQLAISVGISGGFWVISTLEK